MFCIWDFRFVWQGQSFLVFFASRFFRWKTLGGVFLFVAHTSDVARLELSVSSLRVPFVGTRYLLLVRPLPPSGAQVVHPERFRCS